MLMEIRLRQVQGLTNKSMSKSEVITTIIAELLTILMMQGKVAYCVLTGEGRKDTLKLAHLVPASAPASILKTLKLSNDENDIWSLRNVLLLCWSIGYYFNRKKLSFVPNPLY